MHRLVDRQLPVVGANPIAVGIGVGESPGHEHAVGRQAHARHQVGRVEGELFDLGEIIHRIPVEDEISHVDQGVVLVRPGFGQVEGVIPIGFSLGKGHDLHLDVPDGIVTTFNGIKQVFALVVGVFTGHFLGLFVGEAVPTLAGLKVILHPEGLALGVQPLEGVGAESILVAGGFRGAPIPHEVGHLVSGFRGAGPEVPLCVSGPQTRGPHALLGMDEVREFHAVTQEERGGVIAHNIEVAFLRIEPNGEPVHVPPGVGGALLAGDRGEPYGHRGHGVGLEQLRLGVSGHVVGDV